MGSLKQRVALVEGNPDEHVDDYVRGRNTNLARRLARILGADFSEEVRPYGRAGETYFVPHTTLIAFEPAWRLGIRSEHDLFGGLVAGPYQATKALAHDLIAPGADRPTEWNIGFAKAVAPAVLPGFTAFSIADLEKGTAFLLKDGPVRIKHTLCSGGEGQATVRDLGHLAAAVGKEVESEIIGKYGIVVEQQLTDTKAISVGTVTVAGLTISYVGAQRATPSPGGTMLYGGSDLVFVRGGLEALGTLPVSQQWQEAISQARLFDRYSAVLGAITSRRNYDVCQGYDMAGNFRSGVTDHSWRIGGASTLEVTALELFSEDPRVEDVISFCHTLYGTSRPVPEGAIVHYAGPDEKHGYVTVYDVIGAIRRRDGARAPSG